MSKQEKNTKDNERRKQLLTQIPAELRKARQWVLHTPTKKPFAVGDGRPRKGVKWNDPDKFTTLEEAQEALESNKMAAGVGLYLMESDPWAVIDLDSAVLEDGSIAPWAQEIIDLFEGAPVERSVSGKGLHIFMRTSRIFATFSRKGIAEPEEGTPEDKPPGYEAYACRRYIAVTGDWLPGRGIPDDGDGKLPIMDEALGLFTKRHEAETGEEVREGALGDLDENGDIIHEQLDPGYVEELLEAALRGMGEGEELPYAAHRGWMKMRDAVWNTVGFEKGTELIRKHLPRHREGENTEGKLGKRAFEGRTRAPGEGYLRKMAETNIERLEDAGELTPEESEQAVPDKPITKDLLPEIYYSDKGKDYLARVPSGDYISISRGDALIELERAGFSRKAPKRSKGISPAEAALQTIRETRTVIGAQDIAGFDSGRVRVASGQWVLVPKGPERLEPMAGDWSLIRTHLERLFGVAHDPRGRRQLDIFQTWMRVSWLQFKKGVDRELAQVNGFDPAPALYLCGPARCGKSLTQSLITWALGNRSANVASWLKGEERFTYHMFSAEHLFVADDTSTTWSEAERQRYADKIKEIAANRDHQCNPKYGKPFQAGPFWRLSVSLNDNPEHISRIPSFHDQSMLDKLIVLKCYNYEDQLSETEKELRSNRDIFGAALREQIPAWLYYLERMVPPSDAVDNGRYGVCSFQHYDLVADCEEISEEIELFRIIYQTLFDESENPDKEPVVFRPSEVLVEVGERIVSDIRRRRFEQLARSARALTMKLKRVAHSYPHLVEYREKHTFEDASRGRAWIFQHALNRVADPLPEESEED